jgi:cell wall-associated NlpC family hydrolase
MFTCHRRAAPMVLLAVALATAVIPARPAHASTVPSPAAALNWAEAHETGRPYVWGGTGPGFDCSGGVMEAYGHADGIWLPHNTAAMVDSGMLVRTSHPVRGDIAMWGPVSAPYHTGLVTAWPGAAFGPLNSGIPVGWYSWRGMGAPVFYAVR